MTNAKLKVTFTDIEVTRDGDPLDRGELYWSFKVDGSEVASRSSSNPLTIGSGGTISLGQSATVTKSGAVGTNLVISGSASDKDGGKDESDSFVRNHNNGDNWGTNNPQNAHLVDNNLDVTLNYIIERV